MSTARQHHELELGAGRANKEEDNKMSQFTVAALKRLLMVGARVELVACTRTNGEPLPHKDMNVPRRVMHVQSNVFGLGLDEKAPRIDWSWCPWPQASELEEVPGGFAINSDGARLVYLVIAAPATEAIGKAQFLFSFKRWLAQQ